MICLSHTNFNISEAVQRVPWDTPCNALFSILNKFPFPQDFWFSCPYSKENKNKLFASMLSWLIFLLFDLVDRLDKRLYFYIIYNQEPVYNCSSRSWIAKIGNDLFFCFSGKHTLTTSLLATHVSHRCKKHGAYQNKNCNKGFLWVGYI